MSNYKDNMDYKIVNAIFVFAICGTALSLPLWAFFHAIGQDWYAFIFRATSAGLGTLTVTSLVIGWITMQDGK